MARLQGLVPHQGPECQLIRQAPGPEDAVIHQTWLSGEGGEGERGGEGRGWAVITFTCPSPAPPPPLFNSPSTLCWG